MSVRESESHASYDKNDRHDGFSLKWCRYVCMIPLYKEVSHLHASTDRVRIRAWTFDHSQQGDSKPETNNLTCDGTARFVKTR